MWYAPIDKVRPIFGDWTSVAHLLSRGTPQMWYAPSDKVRPIFGVG